MSDVTRDEFDRLVDRVTRVEQTLGATVEIAASELVGLRTYLDERFDRQERVLDGVVTYMTERFGHQERMLDALATEVQAEFDTHAGTLAEHGAKLDAQGRTLADHGAKLDAQGRTLADHGAKLDALLDHFDIDPPS